MAPLQQKINLKLSQRQVLTPSLMQMVSVLALNKLELKEMLNAEMVENPVLEEIEESVPLIDELDGREAERDRSLEEKTAEPQKDPFEEIDFGSYFSDYLDPGYRTASNFEESDAPSFENFLSNPTTLTDHLMWQLGALPLSQGTLVAAEIIIGNLNEDGYLTASLEEMTTAVGDAFDDNMQVSAGVCLAEALSVVQQFDPLGVAARDLRECLLVQTRGLRREEEHLRVHGLQMAASHSTYDAEVDDVSDSSSDFESNDITELAAGAADSPITPPQAERQHVLDVAERLIKDHLPLLQRRDLKEIARAAGCTQEDARAAVELIRTLDPRPGQRYNQGETRLIEPDVAFVKRGDVWAVVINDEDMPTLRLSHSYRRMMRKGEAEKDVREYVKERYRSAIQLLRNIEQRKNTILRTCEAIVERQQEFLEQGVEYLRPMMIKEVAEEISVHPSTVSRAVSNKYVHTPQGVYELRFFFSEGANGPEGADTPLLVLKRRVKKLIEDEDTRHPLTDEQLAAMLQQQGISITRRSVAKYREDMRIPSTHQRRVRS
jgi:RNA polymerase sigma-54 factor